MAWDIFKFSSLFSKNIIELVLCKKNLGNALLSFGTFLHFFSYYFHISTGWIIKEDILEYVIGHYKNMCTLNNKYMYVIPEAWYQNGIFRIGIKWTTGVQGSILRGETVGHSLEQQHVKHVLTMICMLSWWKHIKLVNSCGIVRFFM